MNDSSELRDLITELRAKVRSQEAIILELHQAIADKNAVIEMQLVTIDRLQQMNAELSKFIMDK